MKLPDFSEYFSGEAREYLLSLLRLALAEDGEDLTSDGIFTSENRMRAQIVAKQRTIVAGLPVIPLVMDLCEPSEGDKAYQWETLAAEGDTVEPCTVVACITGQARQVLKAERVILNMVCRLSGIANLTRQYVKALEGTGVRLLDTRKTLPGSRYPDKYAVLLGGGENHRRNLSEMLMVKDNHIDAAGSITAALAALRQKYGTSCPPIEVECRTLDEVREAVTCKADRIMLDNMDIALQDQSLELIPSDIETEISGGVTLEGIREKVSSGRLRPTFVSVGRLTHSAPTADYSMRLAPAHV